MTNEVLGFEGLVGKAQSAALGPDYGGLEWDNFGVVDKNWGKANGYTNDNGYYSLAVNHAVATTDETVPGTTDASFSDSSGTFSVTSGHFDSAWQHGGLEVTFTSYRNGHVVGTMTVDLTETPDVIRFDKDFKHIDKFEITASTGNYDSEVGVDALKIAFDPTNPGPAVSEADSQAVHTLLASSHAALVHDWLG